MDFQSIFIDGRPTKISEMRLFLPKISRFIEIFGRKIAEKHRNTAQNDEKRGIFLDGTPGKNSPNPKKYSYFWRNMSVFRGNLHHFEEKTLDFWTFRGIFLDIPSWKMSEIWAFYAQICTFFMIIGPNYRKFRQKSPVFAQNLSIFGRIRRKKTHFGLRK